MEPHSLLIINFDGKEGEFYEKGITYCVICAGNGGIAMAGYLCDWYKVNRNRTLARIAFLWKIGLFILRMKMDLGY